MSKQRDRATRWRRWGLEALVVVAIVVGIGLWNARGTASGPAPAVRALDLAGELQDLQDYRGRPLLIHFWASWCPICRLEYGSIAAIAEDHPVISISIDQTPPEQLRAYLAEQDIRYPVIHDPAGNLADAWGVRGVPASFIVDGQGEIRFAEVGYTTEPGLRARLWWAGRD